MKKVLYIASEAMPFASKGGLADVIGSLPCEVAKEGVDVRVVMPLHASVSKAYRDKMETVAEYGYTMPGNISRGWDATCFDFDDEGYIYAAFHTKGGMRKINMNDYSDSVRLNCEVPKTFCLGNDGNLYYATGLAQIKMLAEQKHLTVGIMLDMRDNVNVNTALCAVKEGILGKVNNIIFEGQHPLRSRQL